MKLGIIGSAGRGEDGVRITTDVYNQSKKILWKFLQDNPKIDHLISGGAAIMDHLAVLVYLNTDRIKNLTLALPCKFDMEKCQFEDNGDSEWYNNPGKSANYYHRMFQGHNNIKSLEQIKTAIEKGAKVIIKPGFHERNSIIAEKSNLLIAFTFGNKNRLKDGGSDNTMKKFLLKNKKENSYHIDLNDMKLYKGVEID